LGLNSVDEFSPILTAIVFSRPLSLSIHLSLAFLPPSPQHPDRLGLRVRGEGPSGGPPEGALFLLLLVRTAAFRVSTLDRVSECWTGHRSVNVDMHPLESLPPPGPILLLSNCPLSHFFVPKVLHFIARYLFGIGSCEWM